jgi:hypothetical protein
VATPSFKYFTQGEDPIVSVNYPRLVETLKVRRVREADKVTIEIRYPRAKSGSRPRESLLEALGRPQPEQAE